MTPLIPNPGQSAAINSPNDQPVRVVAGAGTGKTEVIARRYQQLLQAQPTWRPTNLLVLTFSEKAAAEMRARILRSVSQSSLGYSRLDLAAAPISTFHAFCAGLLTENSLRARLDTGLPVLSRGEAARMWESLQLEFLARAYRDVYGGVDPLEADLQAWLEGGPFNDAQRLVNELRNQAVPPDAFESQASGRDGAEMIAPLVGWGYRRLEAELAAHGRQDFDRLIAGAAELLERTPGLQAELRAQYRAILVDEFQDTNGAQARLLEALAAPGSANVTVVGDPRQAIYVWRQAEVDNIATFPGAGRRSIDRPLTENRRSLAPILEVANRAMAGYQFGPTPEFELADRLQPCPEHADPAGPVVDLLTRPDRAAEAAAIAAWACQLHSQGRRWGDMALILRRRTFLDEYLAALDAAGVPYELSAAADFFLRPEVMDAIHLVSVCVDPTNDLALTRVLLSPAAGLTQRQVAALRQGSGQPLWKRVREDASNAGPAASQLSRFLAFWESARAQGHVRPPAHWLAWALETSGLQAAAGRQARRALAKLLALAHSVSSGRTDAGLADLDDHLQALLADTTSAKAPELNPGADALRVLTAHASKGLEFDVVFAADCVQKLKPRADNSDFHRPGIGLVTRGSSDPASQDARRERSRRSQNEARCIWYVTLTRARRRLIVTAPDEAGLAGGRFQEANTFFQELWNGLVETPAAGVRLNAPVPEPGAAPAPPPAAEPAPARVGRRPAEERRIPVAPSGFLHYQRCPAAFRFKHLARLEGRPDDDGRDEFETSASGRTMGSVFHLAVAAHARLPDADAAGLLQAGLEAGRLPPEQRRQVQAWIEGYLSSEFGRPAPQAAAVEQPLTLELPAPGGLVALRGVADRLEPGRLVDYKTDLDAAGLAETYGDQLRLYAIMAAEAGRLRPGADLELYHARTGAVIPVPFVEADEARLRRGLLEFFDQVASGGEMPARPGHGCRWCEAHATLCWAGRAWMDDPANHRPGQVRGQQPPG